jgi:hypothetical protein
MQEKEALPRQTAYSYSQPAFTEAALAPGQNSIGTGGQHWIGSNILSRQGYHILLLRVTTTRRVIVAATFSFRELLF